MRAPWGCSHLFCISDVLLHALGGGVLVRADGDGELHAILLAEAVQPVKERLYRLQVVAAGDLAEIIHEHMGNIVIARVHTAQESAQAVKRIHIILAGVDQTDVVADVVGHIALRLDAHDTSGLGLHTGVDELR